MANKPQTREAIFCKPETKKKFLHRQAQELLKGRKLTHTQLLDELLKK